MTKTIISKSGGPKAAKPKPIVSRAKKRKTRQEQLKTMLARKSGATAEKIQTTFGWRPHSVRAAVSGLRKSGDPDREWNSLSHSISEGCQMNAATIIEPDPLTTIEVLDRNACLDLWRDIFGRPPPKHLSVGFMQRALTYEAQCRVKGGVSHKTLQALSKLASGKEQGRVHCHTLKPGNHLVREWNGRTYQVEVLDKGFLMDGKHFASLSAIAKRITGAHWSGPRFFGLG